MHNTPSLPELQRQFTAAVIDEEPSTLSAWVLGNGLTPEARLQIYRNIVRNNHSAALRTAFPVVLKLVGEDFFESAATRYLRDCPTRSGNLQDYGSDCPVFLAKMPEASGLAYLPDVARLEWARQESYLAADAEALPLSVLADSKEPDRLYMRLHPSVRLISSTYPILDIWNFCQDPEPGQLPLSDKQQYVLLWRDGGQIAMQDIDADWHALIEALLKGMPLSDAHNNALNAAKDFDLSICLHWLFTTGLIIDITTV